MREGAADIEPQAGPPASRSSSHSYKTDAREPGHPGRMTSTTRTSPITTLFHCLSFEDADAGMDFLRAVGFVEVAVYRSADDPSVVDHAQFRWGDRGGLMCGSAARTDGELQRRPGTSVCYCVVDSDEEVDAVYERALAAGALGVKEPENPPYGGRDCLVKDTEGNQWSFGSYSGEPA